MEDVDVDFLDLFKSVPATIESFSSNLYVPFSPDTTNPPLGSTIPSLIEVIAAIVPATAAIPAIIGTAPTPKVLAIAADMAAIAVAIIGPKAIRAAAAELTNPGSKTVATAIPAAPKAVAINEAIGPISLNVSANDLTNIDISGIYFKNGDPGGIISSTIRSSIASTNVNPSSGGRGGDEIEEIRQNALYAHSSQLRAVTKNDYIVRALSLPSDYGSISKVYITQDVMENPQPSLVTANMQPNPLSLDLYVLAYNANKQLDLASTTLKQNLVTYINEYRMVTDAINIRDAFYINVGVNFDITTISGFSNQLVLSNCINALKEYFNIEKWQINQPIVTSEIISLLLQIKGVQSVPNVEIINKQDSTGATYSTFGYDIPGATQSGNIYTSADPSIFEIRYPNTDIQGRVITL